MDVVARVAELRREAGRDAERHDVVAALAPGGDHVPYRQAGPRGGPWSEGGGMSADRVRGVIREGLATHRTEGHGYDEGGVV